MPNKRDKLLKRVGELAAALGVSACFIKRMKWAGFPMPGGVSTIAWALDWLKAHPDFKQSEWTKPRRGDEHLPPSDADK